MTDNVRTIRPITADEQPKRGWKIEFKGPSIEEASYLVLRNERMALEVIYGMKPEGYDGITIRGDYGAVVVPYDIIDGTLYVGLHNPDRPSAGEDIWEVPRGFDPKSLTEDLPGVVRLSSERKNANNTWYETCEGVPGQTAPAGVDVYMVRVPLIDDGHGNYRPHSPIGGENPSTAARKIDSCLYFTADEAAEEQDGFTGIALSLMDRKLGKVTFS